MTQPQNYHMINNKTGEYILCSQRRRVVVSEKTKIAYERMYANVGGNLLDTIKFEMAPEVDASTYIKTYGGGTNVGD